MIKDTNILEMTTAVEVSIINERKASDFELQRLDTRIENLQNQFTLADSSNNQQLKGALIQDIKEALIDRYNSIPEDKASRMVRTL